MRTATAVFLSFLSLAAAHSFACAGGEVDNSTSTGDATTSGQGGAGASGGAGGGECVPDTETCDGFDNDCDGEVDEPPCTCMAGAVQDCYSGPPGTEGIGECLAGTQTCDSAGRFGACTGEVVPAAAEECNGLDDDCNDVVDDKGEETCGIGACAVTISICDGGQTGTCTPGSPTVELCDGLDNDCDQLTDESDPAQGTVCQTGIPGECDAGTQQCVMGALTCVADVMPLPETCNGLDDDCNGTIDDNVPGTGGVCDTGFPGPCGPGTIACQGGVVDCFSNVPPSAEVCDGVDNDCEGTIDNQAPCPSPLTCSAGICDLVCVNGTIECNNVCVDPLTDEQNCGLCNNICGVNLVCNNGNCQPPLFTFSGVQTNVPIANLVGWTQCYMDTYANSGTSLSGLILAQCSQANLLLGCRTTGANTLIVAAHAPRLDVIFDTGGPAGQTTTHIANGVGWYFNNSWSWGFALAGDPVTQNSCDTTASPLNPAGPNGNLRLCWHTGGGAINGGWRCGTNTSLNGSGAFQRLIYQAP